MDHSAPPLATVLTEIPDRVFWSVRRGQPVPHFNRVYAEVLRRILGLADLSDEVQLHQLFTTDAPNLSTFQRAVAKEAKRRREAEDAAHA